jgi:hypothetical protein
MKKLPNFQDFTDRENELLQRWDKRNVPLADTVFERRLLLTYMRAQDQFIDASEADTDAAEVLMAADVMLEAPADEADVRELMPPRNRSDELTHQAFKQDLVAKDDLGEEMLRGRRWHGHHCGALSAPPDASPNAVFAQSGKASRRTRLATMAAIGSLSVLMAAAGVALYTLREAQQEAIAQMHRVEQQLAVAQGAAMAAKDLEAKNAALEAKNAVLIAAIDEGKRAQEVAEAAQLQAQESERQKQRAIEEASRAESALAAAKRANDHLQVLLAQEMRRVQEIEMQIRGAKITSDVSIHDPGPLPAPTGPPASRVNAPDIESKDRMPWNTGVTTGDRVAAREAFLEGNRLYQISLFSFAIEKYTEALDKWKHPAIYFNLAVAQLNLGQHLEAHRNLENALRFGAEPLGADLFEEAQNQLSEVQSHLGRIRVNCLIPGAKVTLDGEPLFIGAGSVEKWVSPGAHAVTAKKQDYVPQVERVIVTAGTQQTVTLSPHKLIENRR